MPGRTACPTAVAPIDQPVTNPFVDARLIYTSPRGVRFFGNAGLRRGGLAGLRCDVDLPRLGLGGHLVRVHAAALGCDFPGLGAPAFAPM
jgi:hypothetical protein